MAAGWGHNKEGQEGRRWRDERRGSRCEHLIDSRLAAQHSRLHVVLAKLRLWSFWRPLKRCMMTQPEEGPVALGIGRQERAGPPGPPGAAAPQFVLPHIHPLKVLYRKWYKEIQRRREGHWRTGS